MEGDSNSPPPSDEKKMDMVDGRCVQARQVIYKHLSRRQRRDGRLGDIANKQRGEK